MTQSFVKLGDPKMFWVNLDWFYFKF